MAAASMRPPPNPPASSPPTTSAPPSGPRAARSAHMPQRPPRKDTASLTAKCWTWQQRRPGWEARRQPRRHPAHHRSEVASAGRAQGSARWCRRSLHGEVGTRMRTRTLRASVRSRLRARSTAACRGTCAASTGAPRSTAVRASLVSPVSTRACLPTCAGLRVSARAAHTASRGGCGTQSAEALLCRACGQVQARVQQRAAFRAACVSAQRVSSG